MSKGRSGASLLRIGRSGALPLVLALLAVSLTSQLAWPQTYSLVYSFAGGADGATPYAGLVRDSLGNLYGTTSAGGASNLGTVFKLDPNGTETVLYSFTGGLDGATPYARLLIDDSGNFYGTTSTGGASTFGTVFKLDTNGTETVVHSFAGGADGKTPSGPLVMDSSGNLYGTTSAGGTSDSGIIFKLDANGTETVLYTFTGGTDGASPGGGLLLDSAGNLYGTTADGGVQTCFFGYVGCGVVFKLDTTGTKTLLYSFTGGADGGELDGGLLQDTTGNLYGTTVAGGPADDGVIFKIDVSGTESVLYNFTGGNGGSEPQGTLIFDDAGNLYGTTGSTVFELDPAGKITVLHTFTPGTATVNLYAGLLLDSTGNLYGTTLDEGASNLGTVYQIAPDFSLAVSSFSPNVIKPGSSSTSTVSIAALSAFNASVALSCTVQPASAGSPACSISPASITVGTPATLTVKAKNAAAESLPSRSRLAPFYALCVPLIGVVACLRVGSAERRKRKMSAVLLAWVVFASLLFCIACGGGGSSSSNGGGGTFYTITVTATSGSLEHSTATVLSVQR